MLCNYLDSTAKRNIESCNFNQHIGSRHPDRIMKNHDLVYIREGDWSISQDGTDYRLSAGDVILLQSGHHHYGTLPCPSVVKTCYIHFDSHPDDSVEEEKKTAHPYHVFPVVSRCGENPMVKKYFERVIYSFWADEPHEQAKASAYLDLLLCEISGMREQKPSLAEEIKLLIKRTPHRFITLQELAERYDCSERTVSAKFKEGTGYSLHAWQMLLKCRMADELIRHEPTITLREVASNYGFYDEYHFGKCFKKIMGYSPKRYK